ncbi:hypothetical protein [Devosia sp.]|uniref:hypothetical protein n=1 Tax=Devosia sp. TaxID=1871048 RepID=UPI001B0DFD02|nr:hypothetical protein [Devosia sp.]MBO9588975.1 hypothetical protein [Devosia sp.]
MSNPLNVIVLIGCLIGYLAADILTGMGAVQGTAGSIITSLLPSAFGLAVGLVALRLTK